MKKVLLIAALGLLGITANAQTKFGLKGGYVMSNFTEKYDGHSRTADAKSSFYAGALAEYKLNDKWAFQGELVYADLGAKDKVDGGTVTANGQTINLGQIEEKVDLSTIMLPIGAKYFVTDGLSINGGVNFAFYVSRNIKGSAPDYNVTTSIEANSLLKTFNFAPYAGLEYAFTNKLFVDTRYNFGLSNISQSTEANGKSYKMTNSFWQLGVGYKF